MTEFTNKRYDLEERTLKFSKDIILFCKKLPQNTINWELISQLVRAACSIGANYREANESLSDKDFVHKIKICRKESKETNYWLDLIKTANPNFQKEILKFSVEVVELKKIFSSIINIKKVK